MNEEETRIEMFHEWVDRLVAKYGGSFSAGTIMELYDTYQSRQHVEDWLAYYMGDK